jgi:hypothetical protein
VELVLPFEAAHQVTNNILKFIGICPFEQLDMFIYNLLASVSHLAQGLFDEIYELHSIRWFSEYWF